MKTFEEVVNKEFIDEYGGQISDDYGVVSSDGKVDFSRLRMVFNMFDGAEKPNQFTYALIHGINSLISSWDVPGEFKGKEEDLYALCLKRDVTWQDLIGKPVYKEGVLL